MARARVGNERATGGALARGSSKEPLGMLDLRQLHYFVVVEEGQPTCRGLRRTALPGCRGQALPAEITPAYRNA